MTPEQENLKNQIDNLKHKLEDILYMYGDSDSEMEEAMNTSRFKDLERKIETLELEYNKKFAEGGQTPAHRAVAPIRKQGSLLLQCGQQTGSTRRVPQCRQSCRVGRSLTPRKTPTAPETSRVG